jgi:hypothetical protein
MSDFSDRVNDVMDKMINNLVHDVDGCIMLRELRDEDEELNGDYKLFTKIMNNNKSFDDIVRKSSMWILTGKEDGDASPYHRLMEIREKTPLADRKPPRYYEHMIGKVASNKVTEVGTRTSLFSFKIPDIGEPNMSA